MDRERGLDCVGSVVGSLEGFYSGKSLHFKDSLWHLGGRQTEASEEDKGEYGKLYLESLVIVQARDGAGLDWHSSNRPVRSG